MADCFKNLSELFDDVDENDIKTFLDELSIIKHRGMSLKDKKRKLKELIDSGKIYVALQLKREIFDEELMLKNAEIALDPRAKDVKEGILALNEGREFYDLGMSTRISNTINSLRNNLNYALQRAGLIEASATGRFDREVYKHMHAGTRAEGPEADLINDMIDIFKAHNEDVRVRLNENGADIKRLNTYIHRQIHDGMKIKEVPFEQWASDIIDSLDIESTFGHLREEGDSRKALVDKVLRELRKDYNVFSKKNEGVYTNDLEKQIEKRMTTVDKLNKGRSYIFKDGEKFYDYNQKYGSGKNLVNTLYSEATRSGKTAGLLGTWGSKPRTNYERFVKKTMTAAGYSEKEIQDFLPEAMASFNVVTDSNYAVGKSRIAQVGRNLRAWQILTKLGGASISGMMDIVPTVMHSKTSTGENFFKATTRSVSAFFRSVPLSERRNIAQEMLTPLESFQNELKKHVMGENHSAGDLSRFVDGFFNITGLRWLTEVSKTSNIRLAVEDLNGAIHASKLSVEQKNLLHRYRINDAEVEVLRKLSREQGNLSTRIMEELPDSFYGDNVKKNELVSKVQALYSNRARRGTPTAGAQEFRQLMLYTSEDTVKGQAARFIAQFKSTIMAMTNGAAFMAKASSPDGNIANVRSATNIAQFVTFSTAVGIGTIYLKEIINTGEIPDSDEFFTYDTFVRALQTGGAIGIYGDLLAPIMQDNNKLVATGLTLSAVAGPVISDTISLANEASGSVADLIEGDDPLTDSRLKQLWRQVPYNNLWFMQLINKKLGEQLMQ